MPPAPSEFIAPHIPGAQKLQIPRATADHHVERYQTILLRVADVGWTSTRSAVFSSSREVELKLSGMMGEGEQERLGGLRQREVKVPNEVASLFSTAGRKAR